jgi:hypothetical protein
MTALSRVRARTLPKAGVGLPLAAARAQPARGLELPVSRRAINCNVLILIVIITSGCDDLILTPVSGTISCSSVGHDASPTTYNVS